MRISEIFYSIQGEGTLTGVPSVFVRTSGCNLRCHWCDTPYTSWKPEGKTMSVDEVVAEVRTYRANHVVLTGGEPMIARDIVELSQKLANHGMHITIETAGTVAAPVACDLMSISPKLHNSTPLVTEQTSPEDAKWSVQHEKTRYAPGVLRRLIQDYPYQLKFVVSSPEDLKEVNQIISDIRADPNHVLLMPEGTDENLLRERSQWVAEICKESGYRFTTRLHVSIWGNKRGI